MNLNEMVMEKFAKQMPKRYTKADIANQPRPVLVVAYNKQTGVSKEFVKRLDKTLTEVTGLDRMKIIALDKMTYPQLVKDYGMGIPSITLFRRGKVMGQLQGGAQTTSMEIKKFLNENKRGLI